MGKGKKKSNRHQANGDSDGSDGDHASNEDAHQQEAAKTSVNLKDLDFEERRELQRKAASDKRRSKQKCNLCGEGGHVRRECPGIADDGRGESKFKRAQGDIGSTHLKGGNKEARGGNKGGRRGAKHNNTKEAEAEDDIMGLPGGFSPVVETEENNLDAEEQESSESFLYFDAGCDSLATIEYLRYGRGKQKLSNKEAVAEYQSAMDKATTTSNYGGRISRSLIKPGRPWLISSASPLTGDVLWHSIGLGRDFLFNDTDTEAALSSLLETSSEHESVVGFFCDLDYSARELSRDGCDRESKLRRLRCTCQAAVEAGLPIQIRVSPAAAASRTTEVEQSVANPYTEVMVALEAMLSEYPPTSLKVHLSCWSGDPDHMTSLLQKFPHNIWIGMDGSVTFAKVTRAHECAFEVPLSKVLLETGAPTTIPSQISKSKGREAFCHSGLVPHIAESIAEFKSGGALDVSAEQVARAASANTILLYPKLAVAATSTTVKP